MFVLCVLHGQREQRRGAKNNWFSHLITLAKISAFVPPNTIRILDTWSLAASQLRQHKSIRGHSRQSIGVFGSSHAMRNAMNMATNIGAPSRRPPENCIAHRISIVDTSIQSNRSLKPDVNWWGNVLLWGYQSSSFAGGGPQGWSIRCGVTDSKGKKKGKLKSIRLIPRENTNLCHLKFDATNRLSIRKGKVGSQSRLADYRCARVSVLVR